MLRFSTNTRTDLAIKNIGLSFLIKGGSIIISFILVPLTLGYLNSYEYGVWLTLNSILSWVYVFDIGLGNGLRNKLTEALAREDYELCRTYISTAFFILAILGLGLFGLFSIVQPFLDWYSILNVKKESINGLSTIIYIVFAFIILNFIFKNIGIIFISKQYPAINDLLILIGSLFSLIIIYILTLVTTGSLAWVAYTFSGIPVIIYIISYPITFKRYPNLKPSLKYIDKRYWRSLMELGLKFFLIQISVVIVYTTSNIIISQLFGPEEVTPYNIGFKLFSSVTIVFNLLLIPFWSAITDAISKNDIIWINKVMKKLFKLWGLAVIGTGILVFLSPMIFKIWIGNEVQIPFIFSVLFGIYVCISIGTGIFSTYVNGIGKLRVQLIATLLQAIIFIPFAVWAGKAWGVKGIIISLIFTSGINLVWGPIQCYKLLNGKAYGIWNK